MQTKSPNDSSQTVPSTSLAARAVLGVAIGLLGSFPALFFSTLSVFLKPIAEEFGWGRAQTVGATVTANLGIAIGAIIVGRLIDRFGAHRVVPTSALLMALGIATLGLLPNQPALMAVLSFSIGLVGVGTTPLGYLTVLPRYFDKRLGLSFGLAMAGLGLGTVIMPMLAQQLIGSQGWRMAYASLGALTLGTAAVAWLLLFTHSGSQSNAVSASVRDLSASGMELRAALRDGRFWLLLIAVLAVSAAALGFSVHGVSIMTDRGLDGAAAARIAGLAAIGVMLGRLLGGVLMDLVPATWVAFASFALGGAGLWIFAIDTSQSAALLTLAAFLASFAIGAEGDFIPMAVRRYFGLKAFGAIYGVLFFGYAFGGVLGPVVMGLYFDRLGDYRFVLHIAALVCGVCSVAMLLLGRYRYGSDAEVATNDH
jgi:MFS transporter, OFA family, oxalate/formate antiporter